MNNNEKMLFGESLQSKTLHFSLNVKLQRSETEIAPLIQANEKIIKQKLKSILFFTQAISKFLILLVKASVSCDGL